MSSSVFLTAISPILWHDCKKGPWCSRAICWSMNCKIKNPEFWKEKNIYCNLQHYWSVGCSRSSSQIQRAGLARQTEVTWSLANWNFFSQFCETCESMFLVISIFSEKRLPKKWEQTQSGWPGRGLVVLRSAAPACPCPAITQGHPRPPYIWSTQPNFPLLHRQGGGAPPQMRRLPQMHPELHLDFSPPLLKPKARSVAPQKWPLHWAATRITWNSSRSPLRLGDIHNQPLMT